MSLFDSLGGGKKQQTQLTPGQTRDIQGLKSNPAEFLRANYGLNVSGNNPFEIMDGLAQSGQLNAQQMQRYQMARRMMQGIRR